MIGNAILSELADGDEFSQHKSSLQRRQSRLVDYAIHDYFKQQVIDEELDQFASGIDGRIESTAFASGKHVAVLDLVDHDVVFVKNVAYDAESKKASHGVPETSDVHAPNSVTDKAFTKTCYTVSFNDNDVSGIYKADPQDGDEAKVAVPLFSSSKGDAIAPGGDKNVTSKKQETLLASAVPPSTPAEGNEAGQASDTKSNLQSLMSQNDLLSDDSIASADEFEKVIQKFESWGTSTSPTASLPERLVVVANRLPMTIVHPHTNNNNEYSFVVSHGGLVSGLRGIQGMNFVWIGWPGTQIPERDKEFVTRECQKCGCHPVYLDRTTIDLFYNGFCNNILWPLIHYIPPPIEVGCHDTYAEQWEAYCYANAKFTEAILEVYDDKDFVWIHDYHLMLVPKLLRLRKPDAHIGWFLHTPFPSQEMFRMLPYRTELLTGLLSANFIGFHVYDYLRHFLSSCVQLLGLESSAQGVDGTPVGGVFVNCGAVPIGIQTQQFTKKLKDVGVKQAIRRLKAQFAGRKVILGVDRLDYMKGLPHKLNAFDRFLELYPDWNNCCVLVQLAVPSRSLVPEYQRLKSTMHELVGMINGRRGNLTHVPVHYLDQTLSFDELVALYRVADVALITSLRDGMNLVAYEFIACQARKYGVLILSEFTGAAQSLGAGSIRVNPWNIDETAEAIHRALCMSKAERRSRHDYALNHVRTHTSQKWAEIFIESLRDASERSELVRAAVPPPLDWMRFFERFVVTTSKRRLIVVDLLDALTPARGKKGIPVKRFKRLIYLPRGVLDALNTLSQSPQTDVIITTPHPPITLQRLFVNVSVCLAAEKGSLYRNRAGRWIRFVEEKQSPGFSSTAHGGPTQIGDQSRRTPSASPTATSQPPGAQSSVNAIPVSSSVSGLMPKMSSSNTELGQTENVFLTAPTYQKCYGPRNVNDVAAEIEATPDSKMITVSNEWSSGVEKVMEFFECRTPGSYTERTTGTLTWYWDDALPDFGKQQSRDLLVHLWAGPLANVSSSDVEVVVGSRFIEVRSPACSRTKLLQKIFEHEYESSDPTAIFDVVVCIGNFPRRDEDMHSYFEQTTGSLGVPREGSNNSDYMALSSMSNTSSAPLLAPQQDPPNDETRPEPPQMSGSLGASSFAELPEGKETSCIPTTTDAPEAAAKAASVHRQDSRPMKDHSEGQRKSFEDKGPISGSSDPGKVVLDKSSEASPLCQLQETITSLELLGTKMKDNSNCKFSFTGVPSIAYYSISVGLGLVSKAKYGIPSAYHVQALLRDLAKYVHAASDGEGAVDQLKKSDLFALRQTSVKYTQVPVQIHSDGGGILNASELPPKDESSCAAMMFLQGFRPWKRITEYSRTDILGHAGSEDLSQREQVKTPSSTTHIPGVISTFSDIMRPASSPWSTVGSPQISCDNLHQALEQPPSLDQDHHWMRMFSASRKTPFNPEERDDRYPYGRLTAASSRPGPWPMYGSSDWTSVEEFQRTNSMGSSPIRRLRESVSEIPGKPPRQPYAMKDSRRYPPTIPEHACTTTHREMSSKTSPIAEPFTPDYPSSHHQSYSTLRLTQPQAYHQKEGVNSSKFAAIAGDPAQRDASQGWVPQNNRPFVQRGFFHPDDTRFSRQSDRLTQYESLQSFTGIPSSAQASNPSFFHVKDASPNRYGFAVPTPPVPSYASSLGSVVPPATYKVANPDREPQDAEAYHGPGFEQVHARYNDQRELLGTDLHEKNKPEKNEDPSLLVLGRSDQFSKLNDIELKESPLSRRKGPLAASRLRHNKSKKHLNSFGETEKSQNPIQIFSFAGSVAGELPMASPHVPSYMAPMSFPSNTTLSHHASLASEPIPGKKRNLHPQPSVFGRTPTATIKTILEQPEVAQSSSENRASKSPPFDAAPQ